MNTPKWIFWAGLSAVFGGLLAFLLALPFASAYFLAYERYGVHPFWMQPLRPILGGLLTFAAPAEVYNIYGRVFDLVYLLILPAVFAVHHLHRGSRSRLEQWGFGILVFGLLMTFIGVAGDYWADGATFLIEVLGLLILAISVSLYGWAVLRGNVLPKWSAWLLIASGPGAVITLPIFGHIPSGPTLPVGFAWLVVGWLLMRQKGLRPSINSIAQGTPLSP